MHPTRHKKVILEMFPLPISWLGMEKQNLTQQKHTFINTTQKIKPGLVATYNMRPWNGEGLFLFRQFINLSLTYLLRHLLTYVQPRTHTEHTVAWKPAIISRCNISLILSKHFIYGLPYVIGQTIYIFILSFVLSFFFFFSSPNLSHRRVDLHHTCTHGVALVRI